VSISTLSSFFVTGAAGCVGRAFLGQLGSVGTRVVGLDISSPLEGFYAGEWVRGDILNAGSYVGKLRGIDVVIHLAAMAHSVPRTKVEADRFWKVNLEGTKTLITAAVVQGVRRFVHVSTVAVLSPSTGGIESAYADSKRAAEREVIGFGDRIEVIVVRPTTVYGPNDRGNIFKLIQWIDRGLPAIIGSGENRKSLVYSRNLADVLLFLSEHGKSGESYVITDGRDVSMKEIVREISRSLGRGDRWPSIPLVAANAVTGVNEWIADHFGVPRIFGWDMVAKLTEETVSDPSRLFSLGFRPAYGFERGMAETVQWYKRSSP
jgi:UDP-N-acetyl-alpha-D-quinovosamine dehydrogenase